MSSTEERVLILTPRGRDAAVIEGVLDRSGIHATVCANVAAWLTGLREGAGTALVTEEALADGDTADVFAWLDQQQPWSDFPFIVLATRQAGRRTQSAGNCCAGSATWFCWNARSTPRR